MRRLVTDAPSVCLSGTRSSRLPQKSENQLHYEVSVARVVALPLSRPPYPPEVSGHLVLTIRSEWVVAYEFALGPR